MEDKKLFNLIDLEKRRQTEGIELIASENYASDEVMAASGSILTNKYAEGLPGKRYYGGCAVVDEIEDLCRERLKKLFDASWVNVQPHSGAQANAAVMLALLNPGDKILGFDLAHGGHLTHGSSVNFSGKIYKSFFYGVRKEDGLIDYSSLEKTAKKEKLLMKFLKKESKKKIKPGQREKRLAKLQKNKEQLKLNREKLKNFEKEICEGPDDEKCQLLKDAIKYRKFDTDTKLFKYAKGKLGSKKKKKK